MRWYPDAPQVRRQQQTLDLLVAAAALLFAVAAWLVLNAVIGLTAISAGFTDNATGAQDSWNSIGDALGRVPVVGDQLQESVNGLGEATLGSAAAAGESVTAAVTTTANTLGLVTFAVPAVLLLVLWLPRRLARARGWDAAATALSPGAPLDLVALRALCQLPLADLVRFTPQPFEAYRAGEYEPLAQALYEHEGMLRPGSGA